MRLCRVSLTLVTVFFVGQLGVMRTASAQWLHYRIPGTPSSRDGKVNLKAPVPRTPDRKPDLSGIWAPEPNSIPEILASSPLPANGAPGVSAPLGSEPITKYAFNILAD